jgi:hypothetical protein
MDRGVAPGENGRMDFTWVEQLGGWRKVAGYVVLALGVLWVLRRLLARPKGSSYTVPARCESCGWTGSVSEFKPVCPKCAKPIRL